jgi:Peptidoglycan-synthase activator LpoB
MRQKQLKLSMIAALSLSSMAAIGCRNHQFAHVLKDNQRDMVGSHEAGAETFNVLVDESVAKLLGRQSADCVDPVTGEAMHKRVCFVGVENLSAEDIGDFKDQLFEQIDSAVASSGTFNTISSRYVENGLRQLRLMPEDLMVPTHRAAFQNVMQQHEQPFDYLLFGKLTSGTTSDNKSYQRDYLLTLELIDVNDGSFDKESAKIRKGYHKSRLGKWTKYNLR